VDLAGIEVLLLLTGTNHRLRIFFGCLAWGSPTNLRAVGESILANGWIVNFLTVKAIMAIKRAQEGKYVKIFKVQQRCSHRLAGITGGFALIVASNPTAFFNTQITRHRFLYFNTNPQGPRCGNAF